MKILMVSNTYLPVIGGLERSIQSFTAKFQQWGHDVLIAVPDLEGSDGYEAGVFRLPAIHMAKPSEFSFPFPLFGSFAKTARSFQPDIIHAHHPFWMGEMALKLAIRDSKPLIFTYHIMFDQYAHYLPLPPVLGKRFLVEFAAGFANLSTRVIAPSESVREILKAEGVKTPIDVVPTGIEPAIFEQGNGRKLREDLGIPESAFVIGHIGRLAVEKNLEFLARTVAAFLRDHNQAYFLVAGKGGAEETIIRIFDRLGVVSRLHLMGAVEGQVLTDAYHAMDVFAFASKSETQGMVLCEAMAAGIPVVAIDAPGVREVVTDFENGRLIPEESEDLFQSALAWCVSCDREEWKKLKENAKKTAASFLLDHCARKTLEVYEHAIANYSKPAVTDQDEWHQIATNFKADWKIMANFGRATGLALKDIVSTHHPV